MFTCKNENFTYRAVEVDSAKELLQNAEILVFSGFSGTGKGDVCKHLGKAKVYGKPIAVIRSVTTRSPRFPGENYTFVTKEVFDQMAANGLLLEYNSNFASHCYGTPFWEVHDAILAGKTPLFEIDYSGLERLRSEGKVTPSKLHSVFLVPPSAAELERRLRSRGTESEDSVRARLTRALMEADHLDLYDAVVVNDEVQSAAQRVVAAFEGKAVPASFDAAVFRKELKEILAQQIPTKSEP